MIKLSDLDEKFRKLKELQDTSARKLEELKKMREDPAYRRITVNKRTHRIRFEGETEDEVTIIVEGRDGHS